MITAGAVSIRAAYATRWCHVGARGAAHGRPRPGLRWGVCVPGGFGRHLVGAMTGLIAAAYLGTIVLANWLITVFGVVAVGFGLQAPAGV